MRHAAVKSAIAVISLIVICAAAAAEERIEVRIGDEIVVLEGAMISKKNGRVVIEAEAIRTTTGASCNIKLSGAEQLSLAALTANHISIFMDGNSRLNVDRLAADSMETTVGGFSRIDVQESE